MNEPIDLGQHDVYSAIVGAALAFASDCAPRLVESAGSSMRRRAQFLSDDDSRARHEEAGQLLLSRRVLFEAALPRALQDELHSTGQGGPAQQPLRFDTLELMGEAELEEDLEVLRGTQALLSHVEGELSLVNALVSAARGQPVVRSGDNPLVPQAWVRALRSAARQCHVPAEVRVCWLVSLSEALVPELDSFYSHLCVMLRGWGIQPASFAVTNVHGAQSASGDGSAAGQASGKAAAPLNLRELRRLIAADLRGDKSDLGRRTAGDTRLHAPTVSWALEAVSELNGVDQVVDRVRRRLVGGHLPYPSETSGVAAHVRPDQDLVAEEVVRVLLAKITGDERLLAPVRQLAGQLLKPLQQLARRDARLFRDRNHPARLLLSEFTERSLSWRSSQDEGFAEFFEPVREAVNVLAELEIADSEPFSFALDSLRDVWAQVDERTRKQRAKAQRAARSSEQRKLLARQIAETLQQREDVDAAPALIRSFVLGPWSQVLAAASLARVESAEQEYVSLVNDLIWSAQPRLTAEMRSNLARMIPRMTSVLKRGLATIKHPQEETDAFLSHLAALHDVGMGAAAARSESSIAVVQGTLGGTEQARVAAAPHASASAWAPTQRFDREAEVAARRAAVAQSVLAPGAAEGLRPGMWVDVNIEQSWTRTRLTWVAAHSLLFTFIDAKGQPLSLTRSTLQSMIDAGSVCVVASESPLTTALDAVVEDATRNTLSDPQFSVPG